MQTEMGPTVAMAACKEASLSADNMALNATQFEPMFEGLYLHFWSYWFLCKGWLLVR